MILQVPNCLADDCHSQVEGCREGAVSGAHANDAAKTKAAASDPLDEEVGFGSDLLHEGLGGTGGKRRGKRLSEMNLAHFCLQGVFLFFFFVCLYETLFFFFFLSSIF